jgi:hypothetical protein
MGGTVQAKIFPMTGRVILLLDRGHSSKEVVKYHMKLCGDTPGLEIKDHGNFTRMLIAKPREDSTTRTRLQTWNFLPLLYFWIEDVYGTSPNVKIDEAVARNSGTSKNIGRTDAVLGGVIIHMISVGDCHGP